MDHLCFLSPCWAHSLGHWYLPFAWPLLEIACIISLPALSIPSNSCSFSLYWTLYSSHTELHSVPENLHGLSPFLAFASAIPTAWNTLHTLLLCPPTAPPLYLAKSTYLLGVILNVLLFRKLSSLFLYNVSLDEMLFLCATSNTCYFLQT